MYLITWLWLSGYPLLIFPLPLLATQGLFSDLEPIFTNTPVPLYLLCVLTTVIRTTSSFRSLPGRWLFREAYVGP